MRRSSTGSHDAGPFRREESFVLFALRLTGLPADEVGRRYFFILKTIVTQPEMRDNMVDETKRSYDPSRTRQRAKKLEHVGETSPAIVGVGRIP